MKKYILALSFFASSACYAGFNTSNLTVTSTFTMTQSTIVIHGTTYYWQGGVGTSGQALTTNGSNPATLSFGVAGAPVYPATATASFPFGFTTATIFNFDRSFNADTAKLPGTSSPIISNSSTSITSSIGFDDTSTQTVTWATILSPYNGNTLNADIFYTASGTTGTVNFGIYVMCVTPLDAADVDTASFGTINSTSTTVPGTAGYLTKATVAITNGDTCAANDLIIFKLERTAGTLDTEAGNAKFRRLRIYE